MQFHRTFSGAPWESEVGYCRAIRAGGHIYVTGTAPADDQGRTFAPADAYAQARRCLELIEVESDAAKAVKNAQAKLDSKVLAKYPHIRPVAAEAFGGRYPKGDKHDYTDPEKVRVWTMELGEKLKE